MKYTYLYEINDYTQRLIKSGRCVDWMIRREQQVK